ncbi:MAG: MBL fold metallo-hydrolase [Desulfobulbus propionicus]|nr:MAG: MBL fold metallo-hydrolase [Desulfobulbus propionicus]
MSLCFSVLGSGSKGNCTLVRSGKTTLLIDAGFSGKESRRRLEMVGCAGIDIDAILVTHEHNDHIHGAGVLSRQLCAPVYANPGTHRAAEPKVGKLHERREFATGEAFQFRDLLIHPFAISHDTADPVGFRISDGHSSLGYCTDTGRITRLIEYHLTGCDALVLECNHDPKMLREGPYPLALQQRVISSQGHLANSDALHCAATLKARGRLHLLVMAHLSEVNNHPDIVRQEAEAVLGRQVEGLQQVIARQDAPTKLFRLT